jgi:hypothetical protein
MRLSWQLHMYVVTWAHDAILCCHAHDTCLPYQLAICVSVTARNHQAFTVRVLLFAWVAQACDLDRCVLTKGELGALGKAQDIKPTRQDILTDRAGLHLEALLLKLIQKLCMHNVHLPEVGGASFALSGARPVLHYCA